MDENKKKNTIDRKMMLDTAAYSFLASLLITLFIFVVLIYGFDVDNNSTRRMVKILPFPAAVAGNDIITIEELDRRMDPVKNFYLSAESSSEGKIDFPDSDVQKILKVKKKYILNKLVEDAIIEREATKEGIEITPEMLSQETSRELERYGEKEEVRRSLADLYGWNIPDFEENVVRPRLYEKGLLENLKKTDDSYKNSRVKIEKALDELKEGNDFKSIVKTYSEGESAKNEGDLGWFGAEEMLPEISSVVSGLDKGKTSEIIESSLGYHIVRIEDRKKEDEEEKIRLRQIFVKTKTVSDWLGEYEKTIKIYIPLKDFFWNKDEGRVDFQDKDLQKFEEDIGKNYPGGISTMF